MYRQHWYKPRFWIWWVKNRTSGAGKVAAALIGCALAGAAGYVVADRLSPSQAAATPDVGVRTVKVTVQGATVNQTQTVRGKAQIVHETVAVTHTVTGAAATEYKTTTVPITHDVTVPSAPTVSPPVTKTVTVPVPTTVTVNAPAKTTVQTQLVPTVITTTDTVTHEVTQTVVKVVTS
jgi:hypothetical protein